MSNNINRTCCSRRRTLKGFQGAVRNVLIVHIKRKRVLFKLKWINFHCHTLDYPCLFAKFVWHLVPFHTHFIPSKRVFSLSLIVFAENFVLCESLCKCFCQIRTRLMWFIENKVLDVDDDFVSDSE